MWLLMSRSPSALAPSAISAVRRLCLVVASAGLFATSAVADDQSDCKSNDANLVVKACTKLIKSGKLSAVDKASVLGSRGWAYRILSDYEKSRADWQACAELTPEDGYCSAGFADLALAQSNYDEAISQADIAMARKPKYTWPMAIKGTSLRLKGRYAEAIQSFDQAIEIDSRYTYALYQRGLAYSNNEEFEKAISDYTSALLIDEGYNDARSSRAYANFASGNFELAMTDVNRVIGANPNDHYSWALRGYMAILQETGDAGQAAADLETAIGLSTTVDWYYTYRGLAYIKLGKLDLAKADLDRIIAKYPKSIEDNTYLGMLMEARGDTASAITAYHVALESAPSGIDSRRAQEQALSRLAELDSD